MRKVLIAQDLKPLLMQGESVLNRADIAVFTAATNDDILKTHIEEVVHLIVTRPDLPGPSSESVFDIIRQAQGLKEVLVIMTCEDTASQRERCKRCNANAILAMPSAPGLLYEKVRQFLNVAPRKSYRVALNVAVDGKFNNRAFLCRTENISVTGALVRAELDLALGDRIVCSFYLPDSTKITAHAKVVRVARKTGESKEKLYGIQYTEIDADVKRKMEVYLKKALEHKPSSTPYLK